jgi:hypothetical protein
MPRTVKHAINSMIRTLIRRLYLETPRTLWSKTEQIFHASEHHPIHAARLENCAVYTMSPLILFHTFFLAAKDD